MKTTEKLITTDPGGNGENSTTCILPIQDRPQAGFLGPVSDRRQRVSKAEEKEAS